MLHGADQVRQVHRGCCKGHTLIADAVIAQMSPALDLSPAIGHACEDKEGDNISGLAPGGGLEVGVQWLVTTASCQHATDR